MSVRWERRWLLRRSKRLLRARHSMHTTAAVRSILAIGMPIYNHVIPLTNLLRMAIPLRKWRLKIR